MVTQAQTHWHMNTHSIKYTHTLQLSLTIPSLLQLWQGRRRRHHRREHCRWHIKYILETGHWAGCCECGRRSRCCLGASGCSCCCRCLSCCSGRTARCCRRQCWCRRRRWRWWRCIQNCYGGWCWWLSGDYCCCRWNCTHCRGCTHSCSCCCGRTLCCRIIIGRWTI